MGADPLAAFLMPKLRRCASRDEACAEVLRAVKSGRGLDNALLDVIESFPQAQTTRLRNWIEEARGLDKSTRRRDPAADDDAATELLIYLDNEPRHYEQKKQVAKMLARKLDANKYDHKLAWKAWAPVVQAAAQGYSREFSASPSDWTSIFVPATRDLAAKELADRWYANAKAGRPEEV